MKTQTSKQRSRRRAFVLVIAMGLLTLFAGLGVAFAILSRSESLGARNFKRTAQNPMGKRTDVRDSRALLSFAMSQLVYDTNRRNSAMRGHSLLRDMYGGWDDPASNAREGVEIRPFRLSKSGTGFEPVDYEGVFNGTGIPFPLDGQSFAGADNVEFWNNPLGMPDGVLGCKDPNSEESLGVDKVFPTDVTNNPYLNERLAALASFIAPPGYGVGITGNNEFARMGILSSWAFDTTVGSPPPNKTIPPFPLNFTIYDRMSYRFESPKVGPATSREFPEPEKYFYSKDGAESWHFFGYDEDYDAPDHNNMFLAMERADGTMINPSFHRPWLIAQVSAAIYGKAESIPDKVSYNSAMQSFFKSDKDWSSTDKPVSEKNISDENKQNGLALWETNEYGNISRSIILRHRRLDVCPALVFGKNGAPATDSSSNRLAFDMSWWNLGGTLRNPVAGDFDMSGAIGDCHEELDVDTDGDGVNDAIWLDLGYPANITLEDGRRAKALFAFKILDLDGRINLNTAGNAVGGANSGAGSNAFPQGHVSNLGASPTEVNPLHALTMMEGFRTMDQRGGANSALRSLLVGNSTPSAGQVASGNLGRWSARYAYGNDNRDFRAGVGVGDSTNPDDDDTTFPFENGNSEREYAAGTIGLEVSDLENFRPAVSSNGEDPSNFSLVFGPADYYGSGRYYEPFLDDAMQAYPAWTSFNRINPVFANYFNGQANTWQGSFQPSSLQSNQLAINEAYEFNPYEPSVEDNPITGEQFQRLFRVTDIDYSNQELRTDQQFGKVFEAKPSDAATYDTAEVSYMKRRLRKLFTYASWDLNHYNPVAAYPNFNSPVLKDSTTTTTSTSHEDMSVYVAANTDANGIEQRGHNGTIVPPTAPVDYNKPVELRNFGQTPEPIGSTGGVHYGYRLPEEVARGRRYDLNRPLSAYSVQVGDDTYNRNVDIQRTAMAQQLYVLLWLSVRPQVNDGLNEESPPNPNDVAGLTTYRDYMRDTEVPRTLAQLAVNIVDFIDSDDVMTYLVFDPNLNNDVGWQDITQSNPAGSTSGGTSPWDLPNELNVANTVMGFELPRVVINEAVSVFHPFEYSGPGAVNSPEFRAKFFTWVELFVPGEQPVRLSDSAREATGSYYPMYLLSARLNPETGNTPLRTNPDPNCPVGGADPNAVPLQDFKKHFVTFANADAKYPDDSLSLSADLAGRSYIILAPDRSLDDQTNGEPQPDMIPDFNFVDATVKEEDSTQLRTNAYIPYDDDQEGETVANVQGALKFTHRLDHYLKLEDVPSHMPMTINLYRLRNPYLSHDQWNNPYVIIDQLQLPFRSKNGSPDKWIGSYRTNYESGSVTPVAERISAERRQPWHGSQMPICPNYPDDTDPTSEVIGSCMGFPLLNVPFANRYYDTDKLPIRNRVVNDPRVNARLASTITDSTSRGNSLFNNGFVGALNVANADGIVETHTFGSANSTDAPIYASFPFANRQLASPLELLSVRLYGSHYWTDFRLFTGQLPTAREEDKYWKFGNVQSTTKLGEWRLRFTDDFEYIPNDSLYGNGIWRSRQVPWFLDNRMIHPLQSNPLAFKNDKTAWTPQRPVAGLHRFFEFVECRSRFNGSGGWDYSRADNTAANAYKADLRESRVPGKVNLNTITEEEVFRALVDTEAALPSNSTYWPSGMATICTDSAAPLTAYDSRGVLKWNSLFGPGLNYTSELATGTILAQSGSTDAKYYCYPTTGNTSIALDFGGYALMNTYFSSITGRKLNQQWGGIFSTTPKYASGPAKWPGSNPYFDAPDKEGYTVRPDQVGTELFREFLLSRAGMDGIFGTMDDKPFRSFAAPRVDDTIFRRRNFALLDVRTDFVDLVRDPNMKSRFQSTRDPVKFRPQNTSERSYGAGHYFHSIGGQWTPRLFDPIAQPYGSPTYFRAVLRDEGQSPLRISNVKALLEPDDPPGAGDTNYQIPGQFVNKGTYKAPDLPIRIDYWMQEHRRNKILTKLANNTTTRSNVFAVWVTVGIFAVEHGTDQLAVPLLNEEVGSREMAPIRHRAFFIVDRTLAKEYKGAPLTERNLEQIIPIVSYTIME